VIGFQTTFLEQLFDVAQRKGVPKIPTDRTKNQLRLGLPPFEDRRPGRHSGIFNVQHRRLRKLQHSRFAGSGGKRDRVAMRPFA
jgi:hypothetical protein